MDYFNSILANLHRQIHGFMLSNYNNNNFLCIKTLFTSFPWRLSVFLFLNKLDLPNWFVCVQSMRLTGDLYQDSHCLVTRLSRSFIPRNRFNHPSRFVARLRLKAIFNIVFFYPILSHSILLGTGWILLKSILVTDKYLVWLHFSLHSHIYIFWF